MTTEQYSIGYEAGYQDGWDAALAEQPAEQENVRDAETELNCAEEVLDGYAAHLDLEETAFDCIGDYIRAVCEALKTSAPQPKAEQGEPVAWEWRWFDASPYTVTSGQWSEWKRVEPRDRLCTVEGSLNEFRSYIADGQRYELRALYTAPQPAKPAEHEPVEMSPEFTDTARAALLWVLWHHQGGSSPVGQPIRFALGMGAHDCLTDLHVAEAKRWAAQTGSTTADFHAPQPTKQPLTDEDIDVLWRSVPNQALYEAVKDFARAIERAHGINVPQARGGQE